VRAKHFAAACILTVTSDGVSAQRTQSEKPPPKGWEFVGLPAVNFNSDEGVGYGALLEAYNYGNGVQPYRFTIQPIVFFTTKGRRDFVIFFDAPNFLRDKWRLDAFAGREQQLATPYYGIGNDAAFDELLEDPPNDYYYRYGRTQLRILANLQRKFGRFPARGLFGAGFADVRTDATPFDSGTTLLAQQLGSVPEPSGRLVYLRTGLVWDTRDREIAPSRGSYGDLLVQRVDRALGATNTYTRYTAIGRKYFPLRSHLVLAHRALVQKTDGNVPLYDLATVQTSFKQHEALGGSSSIRGLPKNRFVGKGIAFLNTDLRWRFLDFELRRKSAYLTWSGFFDVGRVWLSQMDLSEIGSGAHTGYGTGIRLGLGPNSAVGLDLARSPESKSTQIYIGLGYPF